MKTSDAVSHFGSRSALARALGISRAAVAQWGCFVPKGRAYEIHVLTGGALEVRDSDYPLRTGVAGAAEKVVSTY